MSLIARFFGKAETPPAPAVATPPAAEQPTLVRRARPLHPQAKRLRALIDRRKVHAAELEKIELERDADARPFAEDLDRLEEEQLAAQAACAAVSAKAVDADERIASHRIVIAALVADNDRWLQEAADLRAREYQIGLAIEATRAKFDDAITPPHAKHLRHRMRHLDEQIDKIIERHPELQVTDIDTKVDAEMVAQGIPERVQKVAEAFGTKEFGAGFKAALDEAKGTDRQPRNEEMIRSMALAVLHGLGVPTQDVHFHVIWGGPKGIQAKGVKPNELVLSPPSISAIARERCKAAVLERARVSRRSAA